MEANRWIWDGEFRQLDEKTSTAADKIAFNTFPRSGNSMLRRFMEQVSGVSTGASTSLNTSTLLQNTGLKGEEVVDDRAFICKAHHPMLMPGNLPFQTTKVICQIRNPLDVMVSFACLTNTLSHTVKPDYEFYKDYPEWWTWWVKLTTGLHKQFFDTIVEHGSGENKSVATYFVRFEDMLLKPEQELEDMFKFILDLEDLEGTNVQRRIKEVIAMGAKAAALPNYKLKKDTGKFTANMKRYNEEELSYIKEHFGHMLYFFGYTNHPEESHATEIFNFDEHTPENLERFNGFRKFNAEAIKDVTKVPRKKYDYPVNQDFGNFPMFTPQFLEHVQKPGYHDAKRNFKIEEEFKM